VGDVMVMGYLSLMFDDVFVQISGQKKMKFEKE
jgi:hypothetical protein